ncbi:MAG: Mor transcription activator family protein, partial [Anaerotignaceae bacterium]
MKIKDISVDDLQEQHKQYGEIIGIESMIALSKEFGGTPFYVPTIKELLKNTTYGAMIEEYDGTNIKKLAVKYGVSVST